MIVLATYSYLPDLISISTRIAPHMLMHQYDSNCTSRTNLFDHAGTPCHVFEPEPLNAFESIKAILAATFEEEPLEVYFWEQSDIPSP
jgi:hypothetical protein